MSGKLSNNGWALTDNGWEKIGEGKGNADYFKKEIPPVRDTWNRPIKNGRVDTERWIKEVNEGKWCKP